MGCTMTVGEQAMNIGRNAALAAGFPDTVPGTTVDRQCGSAQQAVHFAAQAVMAGAMDVVIGAGVESMSRVPIGSTTDPGPGRGLRSHRARPLRLHPSGPVGGRRSPGAGTSAREGDGRLRPGVAPPGGRRPGRGGASPGRSWHCAPRSRRRGRHPRRRRRGSGATRASRSSPASPPPSPRTGSSPPGRRRRSRDGAAAVLVMSEERADAARAAPRARFHTFAVAANDPVIMLTAPIPATRLVLKRAARAGDMTWWRSTRPSPRWCWPGNTSCAPTWRGSTSTGVPSPSAIPRGRGAPHGDDAQRARAHQRPLRAADHVRRRRAPTPPSSNAWADPRSRPAAGNRRRRPSARR